ncbi:MAG: hypothetical protein EXR93_06265 [Gemmatimonadetes bacterium]|nr:hypothetical protein [Gemmatimonadota bacterium]
MTPNLNAAARRAAAMALLLIGTMGVSGCAMTFDARTLGANTMLSAGPGAQPQGEEFHITRTGVYLLWGLAAASQPSLERVLAGQITGGQQVANLRIRVRSRLGDLVATVLTAGFIVPRSFTFEGIIVPPQVPPAQ